MADAFHPSQQKYSDSGGDYAAYRFLVSQMINRVATTALVQVTKVTSAGEVAPVGLIDVHPMVAQVDGDGNVTPHGVISNVPYFRLVGGANAVIIDPAVGDIGIAVFCSRDISAVKATKKPGPPGSFRRYDWSDAIYLGSTLSGTPTQYIRFHASGVSIVTPGTLTFAATNATLDAAGNLATTGEITRGLGTGDQITLGQHRHGVGSSAAGTVVPTPGT